MAQGNMGLGLAGGAEALSENLRQQILDRLNAQSQAQQMDLNQRGMALKEQEARQKEQDFQQTLAERQAAETDRQQAQASGNWAKLAPTLPMDQNVAPEAVSMAQKAGASGQLYAPPTMGDTASGAPFNPATANPSINLGTAAQQKDEADTAKLEAIANDPNTTPAVKGFLRIRAALPKGENVPYQLITEPNGPVKPVTDASYTLNGKGIVAQRNSAGRLMYQGQDVTDRVTPYVPPQPPASRQLEPELDATGKPTGRYFGYDPKTNAMALVQGAVPVATKAPPGAAQFAVKEADRQSAIGALDQLDQSIESAKGLIGPGAGQVTSLEQLAGLADPRAQALGAKMLLAKMKVDSGIGGARAAASPQLLARWDNLLANKVTPEDLHAAVQAMREIVGGTTGGKNVEHWVRDASGQLVKQ